MHAVVCLVVTAQWPPLLHMTVTAGVHCSGHPCYTWLSLLACTAVATPLHMTVTAGVLCSGHSCYTWLSLLACTAVATPVTTMACTAVATPVTHVTAGVHCSGHPCYTCHCWRALQWSPVTPVTAGVHCSGYPSYTYRCWGARRVVAACTGRAGPRRRAAAGEGLHRRKRALQLRRVGALQLRRVGGEGGGWRVVNVVTSILYCLELFYMI